MPIEDIRIDAIKADTSKFLFFKPSPSAVLWIELSLHQHKCLPIKYKLAIMQNFLSLAAA
jgi:hypothetical protein